MNVNFYLIQEALDIDRLEEEFFGDKNTLVFLFSSVQIDLSRLREVLKRKGVSFVGCSTAGEIFMREQYQDEVIFRGSAVVGIFEFSKEDMFLTKLVSRKANETSRDLGKRIGVLGKEVFTSPAFVILGAGLGLDGEELVNGIKDIVGKEVTVYGGLAGDDELYRKTYAFTQEGISSDGVGVLILNEEEMIIDGVTFSGWECIEGDILITSAKGNEVFSINHKPALDFYLEFLEISEEDFPQIGVEYPLIFYKDDGREVIRACISVDRKKRSLIFGGTVPEGIKGRIGFFPGKKTVEATIKAIKEKASHGLFPEVGVLFSCIGRYTSFGQMIEDEIRATVKYFNCPIIGFFTYGEFGKRFKESNFHNLTYTLMLLKEKLK